MRWLPPLGFENTYAMSVRTEMAERLGLRTLSDFARVSGEMRAGFTADFIGLADGLPGLREAYGLRAARGQRAGAGGEVPGAGRAAQVDIIDAYSTDGLLGRYPLTVLEDDRHFFPPYDAAALVRAGSSRASGPRRWRRSRTLSGRLDVRRMRRLNERVEVNGEDVAVVARDALARAGPGDGHRDAAQSPARGTARRRAARSPPTCGSAAPRSPR